MFVKRSALLLNSLFHYVRAQSRRKSGTKIRLSLVLLLSRKQHGTGGLQMDAQRRVLSKINTRAEFRKRMRVCAANSERKRIQRFDTQFKQRSSNRFKLTSNKKHTSSLRVNQLTQKPSYWHGKITSDRLVLQIPTNLQQLCTAQSKRSMS